MKDEEYGMFLEWALLSQTQAQQTNRILKLNTQVCNTINTLDFRNWCTVSSVNAASHVFIHEALELREKIEEKESVFEKIRKALYTLVDELNIVVHRIKANYTFCSGNEGPDTKENINE